MKLVVKEVKSDRNLRKPDAKFFERLAMMVDDANREHRKTKAIISIKRNKRGDVSKVGCCYQAYRVSTKNHI